MAMKLSELVAKFGGELIGRDITISGVAPTNLANITDITFLSDQKYKKHLKDCGAGAIIVSHDNIDDVDLPKIVTSNPYYYFSLVSNLLYPRRKLERGIAPSAQIDQSVIVATNPAIAANVVISKNSQIGDNCDIHANVVIGEQVIIGNNVTIYPNVVIYDKVTIGNNCVLHSGCVVGSDGFGNAQDQNKHYHRIAQIGGVIIGDDVEIGANTTIDCGTFEPTLIDDGVRIDNLVQIAHNVAIGKHTGIAANVGIAGGTKIGKHCTIGGGAGITGHIEIADYSVVGGASNVGKSITQAGIYSSAFSVMNYKDWAKIVVHLRNFDKLNQKLKELQIKINYLENKNG